MLSYTEVLFLLLFVIVPRSINVPRAWISLETHHMKENEQNGNK